MATRLSESLAGQIATAAEVDADKRIIQKNIRWTMLDLKEKLMRHRGVIPTLASILMVGFVAGTPGSSLASPRKAQPGNQAKPQTRSIANASKDLDACSLLTGAEIAGLLGEPLDTLHPSVSSAGNLKISHCLFVTRNFAKSASLDVAMPASGDSSGRSLRTFWRNQFHSQQKDKQERLPASHKIPAQLAFSPSRDIQDVDAADNQSESEEESESGKARAIPALGEEAYWVGSRVAGALYVLQGNRFLRISVGGIPNETTRIAKSKTIASAVLPRLMR